jgi:hypothetical protein
MTVGILCESPVDEVVIRGVADCILGIPTSPPRTNLQALSWPGPLEQIELLWRKLHFDPSVGGFIVVVDGDLDPVHSGGLGDVPCAPRCRLCALHQALLRASTGTAAVPGRMPLKTAIGMPYPALEAWLLCRSDPGLGEATWRNRLAEPDRSRITHVRRSLKERFFGTSFGGLRLLQARAEAEVKELVRDLSVLEKAFPAGFGTLVGQLRSWLPPRTTETP